MNAFYLLLAVAVAAWICHTVTEFVDQRNPVTAALVVLGVCMLFGVVGTKGHYSPEAPIVWIAGAASAWRAAARNKAHADLQAERKNVQAAETDQDSTSPPPTAS